MNFLDLIFPKFCLECKKQGRYICQKCVEKVLDGTFDENNFSVFKYKGVIKKAISALKYRFAQDVADDLVDNVVKRLVSTRLHSLTLVPVPLHIKRQNFRGFNQSEVLGEKLAMKMGWEYVSDLLFKNNNTHPQVGLKGEIRVKNVSNVFGLNPKTNLNLERPILIFDDVYTTGSTIKEARRVLNDFGFKKIYSLTVAR